MRIGFVVLGSSALLLAGLLADSDAASAQSRRARRAVDVPPTNQAPVQQWPRPAASGSYGAMLEGRNPVTSGF